MKLKSFDNLDLSNKKVLLRVDLNVPLNFDNNDLDEVIADDTRIKAIIPTINALLAKNAAIIILSHLGRPKEGEYNARYSLEPVAYKLTQLLDIKVKFERNWLTGIELNAREICLCENVRFMVGEEENDDVLAKKIAAIGDVLVMDAFAVAHRKQASTYGVAKYSAVVAAGLLFIQEITSLNKILYAPKRPLVAIVSGSKIPTKLNVLKALMHKVDVMILGGGIANTFLAATGVNVGNSLCEKKLINTAKELIGLAKSLQVKLILPQDVLVTKDINSKDEGAYKSVTEIANDEMIVDFGNQALLAIEEIVANAATIFWNGPLGIFEVLAYAGGTQRLVYAIANSKAFCVAGGGDTIAAINQMKVAGKVDYISTGGGAMLEYIENSFLPVMEYLIEN